VKYILAYLLHALRRIFLISYWRRCFHTLYLSIFPVGIFLLLIYTRLFFLMNFNSKNNKYQWRCRYIDHYIYSIHRKVSKFVVPFYGGMLVSQYYNVVFYDDNAYQQLSNAVCDSNTECCLYDSSRLNITFWIFKMQA